MSESLIELGKINVWANDRLFEACESLDDAQLNATMVGGFSSIRDTLTHIAGAQERLVAALAGEEQATVSREGRGFPGVAELRAIVKTSGEKLVTIAEHEPPGTVTTMWKGEAFTPPVWLMMNQAIIHGIEHRTQVAAILTQLGIDPPGMDAWTYHEDQFAGDWSNLWST